MNISEIKDLLAQFDASTLREFLCLHSNRFSFSTTSALLPAMHPQAFTD